MESPFTVKNKRSFNKKGGDRMNKTKKKTKAERTFNLGTITRPILDIILIIKTVIEVGSYFIKK